MNRPSGFEIAIVQCENHDDAIKAQKLGVKFAIASDPNDSEYLRRYIEDGKDLAGNDAVGTATLRPRVRPRKLLNPELYKWRAAMREKHREASERREELLKVGTTTRTTRRTGGGISRRCSRTWSRRTTSTGVTATATTLRWRRSARRRREGDRTSP